MSDVTTTTTTTQDQVQVQAQPQTQAQTKEDEAVNKAGLTPIPTDRYIITGSDVVKFLEDQLGFAFGYDFTRWTGTTPDSSYVRMRLVFQHSDIVAKNDADDFVSKTLNENAAGFQFKDTFIETIKPYTYPEINESLNNHPEDLKRMYDLGLMGDRLYELQKYGKLNFCASKGVWRIYLAPEKIIYDMLSNPKKNKPNGKMSIVAVLGTSSDTIRWDVAVSRKNSFDVTNTDISVDAVYRS